MQQDLKTPDPFLAADVIRADTFIRYVEVYETLESTNDRARELATRTDVELPALVATRLQTAGRGRGRHSWWAADGALTFSVLLNSSAIGLQPLMWPRLSLATAVAVCDTLEAVVSERTVTAQTPIVQLKWPNDVLLGSRKVSGILIESPSGTNFSADYLVMGVGINVNNSFKHAPPELRETGIALCDVICQPVDLQTVLIRFLAALSTRVQQLKHDNVELPQAWRKRNFFAGKCVTVEDDGRRLSGRCADIAADGGLLLETAGDIQRIYTGSVRTE